MNFYSFSNNNLCVDVLQMAEFLFISINKFSSVLFVSTLAGRALLLKQ